MKKQILTGLVLVAVLLTFGTGVFAQIKTGGYKTIAVDDDRVVAAADFAVEAHVKKDSDQEGLEVDTIHSAETQVVAGTNFRICMTVKLGDEKQQVKTVVYQNLQRAYTLTSWSVEKCAREEEANEISPALELVRLGIF